MFRPVVAIFQARLGSSRLPQKTLMELCGHSLLEHIVERVRACRTIDRICVATTTSSNDNLIEDLCEHIGVDAFRGSEDDVLDRFHSAATALSAGIVVRVTADDPFKDPDVIDLAVETLKAGQYDYVSNTLEPTYPEGIDIEAFQFSALDRAHREAKLLSEREHVTPYIWKHPERFRIHCFKNDENLSHLRWTIDYEQDLGFAREVYRRLYPSNPAFRMKDILTLLRSEPKLMEMNQGIVRNEGYQKSIQKETAQ